MHWLVRLDWLHAFYGSSNIFRISRRRVIKTGWFVRTTEAATMRYVARHTSIPVPKVYDAWTLPDGRGGAISMEWIEGAETLERRWPSMSNKQKLKVVVQLRGYVDELRSLSQPPDQEGWIGPLDSSPCWDARLKGQPCGPFPSERAFNQFRLSLLDQFK
ncbi:hypothetical protein HYDPIDRAFT_111855 [Hydnomerulius pinastri MD-312]|uniref:Aminoglycoside phosphotransferase domain-containing protein n=1 Tax=Hydnomerulius pinastri MD-312 TaxID=994086 RepID=A0A0C9WF66_9AGAM|nr:hypothetical protein HYDPIDRAFT_111855 [Hydnomerulius pinastri MD-312]